MMTAASIAGDAYWRATFPPALAEAAARGDRIAAARRRPQLRWGSARLGCSSFLDDAAHASEVLLEGGQLPGAPPFLKSLAAQVLVKGGERQSAKMLWQQIYEQSEPGQLKDNAGVHLGQLQSLDAIDALNVASEEFARRTRRPPASLEELRRSGRTAAPIVDAAGTPFEYNASTGKASLSPRSPIWRRELAK
jgi:hypothetical protein